MNRCVGDELIPAGLLFHSSGGLLMVNYVRVYPSRLDR